VPAPTTATATRRVIAVLLAVVVGALVSACGNSPARGTATYGPGAGAGSGAIPTPSDATALAPASPVSGLRTMLVAQLPKEGVDTLRLIAKGGPYPFSKDGVTFSNREGLLPKHKDGWYHEFTVITPGSNDRGARRVIAGDDGGRFYTDDHYASFREVLSGVSA